VNYGNPTHYLRRVLIHGFVLGVVTVAIALILCSVEGTLDLPRWPWLVFLLLLPPAALVAAVVPTVFFCIRVIDGRIQHVFARRFILSDYAMEDFVSVNLWEGGWGAVLHFTGGRKIRFVGAHFREIGRLAEDLSRTARKVQSV
jgi:hypothetical protein